MRTDYILFWDISYASGKNNWYHFGLTFLYYLIRIILWSLSFMGSILNSALIMTKWANFVACLNNFNLKCSPIIHPQTGT